MQHPRPVSLAVSKRDVTPSEGWSGQGKVPFVQIPKFNSAPHLPDDFPWLFVVHQLLINVRRGSGAHSELNEKIFQMPYIPNLSAQHGTVGQSVVTEVSWQCRR